MPAIGTPSYRPSVAAAEAVNTPTGKPQENGQGQGGYSLVPDAGVYAQGQAAANKAYQDAVASLQAKKNSSYHAAGLTNDAKVDPLSQFGEYQQMLGGQGRQLDLADEEAVARGLGTGGLAMQGESALRPGFGADNLAFQGRVEGIGQDYTSGVQSAEAQRARDMQQALQDAINAAVQNSWFTPYDPGPQDNSGGGDKKDTGTTALAKKVASTKPYAVNIKANKTGGSANKKQGIFAIH